MSNYKDIFLKIIDKLSSDNFFSDYKFRKRDSQFIKKNNDGNNAILLQFYDGYDLKRDKRAVKI